MVKNPKKIGTGAKTVVILPPMDGKSDHDYFLRKEYNWRLEGLTCTW